MKSIFFKHLFIINIACVACNNNQQNVEDSNTQNDSLVKTINHLNSNTGNEKQTINETDFKYEIGKDGIERWYFENGQIRRELDKEKCTNKLWYKNGQIKTHTISLNINESGETFNCNSYPSPYDSYDIIDNQKKWSESGQLLYYRSNSNSDCGDTIMIWDENGQMLEHTIFNCYLKEFGGERGLDIEEEICFQKTWYSNGQIKCKLTNEESTEWYKNGQTKREVIAEESTEWYENGQIKYNHSGDTIKTYFENGALMEIKVYKEGTLEREFTSRLTFIDRPDTSFKISIERVNINFGYFVKSWFENGQLKQEVKNGVTKTYYNNGQIKEYVSTIDMPIEDGWGTENSYLELIREGLNKSQKLSTLDYFKIEKDSTYKGEINEYFNRRDTIRTWNERGKLISAFEFTAVPFMIYCHPHEDWGNCGNEGGVDLYIHSNLLNEAVN